MRLTEAGLPSTRLMTSSSPLDTKPNSGLSVQGEKKVWGLSEFEEIAQGDKAWYMYAPLFPIVVLLLPLMFPDMLEAAKRVFFPCV